MLIIDISFDRNLLEISFSGCRVMGIHAD